MGDGRDVGPADAHSMAAAIADFPFTGMSYTSCARLSGSKLYVCAVGAAVAALTSMGAPASQAPQSAPNPGSASTPSPRPSRSVTELLAIAKASDSRDKGLDGLRALAEALAADPANEEARQLRQRIASRFMPTECEVVAWDPDPAKVTDAAARARIAETGLPWRIRHRASAITMLLCPPGEFVMGSTRDTDERPTHTVRITRPFWLGETEVTRAQWCSIMGGDPTKGGGSALLPAAYFNWHTAVRMCEGLGPAFRLPTEAEWEYACRGGTDGRFSFAADGAGTPPDEYAWYRANSKDERQPVATRRPNPWGFHDMHGNLGEWCSDWYSVTYYGESPNADPTGPATGEHRVTRGGSHLSRAPSLSCSNRDMFAPGDPDGTFNDVGLRVARTAQ